MTKLELRPITIDNLDSVIALSDTLNDQQKRCVAPNIYSLAEAYVNLNNAWTRAIYLGDIPIGFIMLALKPTDIPNPEKAYFLWRFMIDGKHHNKGYGKQVIDLIVEKCKEDQKEFLYTSCDMESDMPYQFYLKYGFIDTGVMDEDEEILKLDVSSL